MKIKINYLTKLRDVLDKKFHSFEEKIFQEKQKLDNIQEKKDKENIDYEKNKDLESSNKKFIYVSLTNRSILKFWFFALLVGIVGYFAYNSLSFIIIIISAYIVSIIVESLIYFFQSTGLNRGFSIFISYLIFLISLFLLFIIVLPFLINQTIELISLGLNYLSGLQNRLVQDGVYNMIMSIEYIPLGWKETFLSYFGNSNFLIQLQDTLQQNLSEVVSLGNKYLKDFGSFIFSFVSGFTTFIVNFLLFLTLSVLFSAEKDKVVNFLAKFGGKDNYNTISLKIKKIYKKLSIWLKARLLMSLFITIAMWFALIIMSWFGVQIPNKLGIAIIIGLLDIIPYIGPVISGALLFVVGLLYNSFLVSGLSIGILSVVNIIQNNVLTPIFMNKALGVSSVLIFISMILGGLIMGFFGVLLAVPIAVIITLLFQNKSSLEKEEDDSGPMFNWFDKIISKIKKFLMKKK